MARVRIEGITKTYGSKRALNGMSFDAKDGELVALLGPSGAGKTTTFRIIAGVETSNSGNIYMDDVLINDVSPKERDVAMVFQSYALFPNMNVYRNLAFPLKMRGFKKDKIDERVKETAKMLRIDHLLEREVTYLSGGERQRVAVGGAMVRKAKLLLLDEPLTNLDAKLRAHMRLELRKLQKEIGQTTIFNTPDQLEALTMADRIAVVKDGKVQQYDTCLNVYNNPKTTFVADFTGSPGMNLVDCLYKEKDGSAILANDGLAFDITQNRELVKQKASGDELVVGIRPADLSIAKERRAANDIPGEVYVVEPTGFTQIIDFKVGSQIMKIETLAALKCDLGDKVFVAPNMSKLHVFDKKTGEIIY